MNACIRSIGSYIPRKVMTNDELSKRVDTSDEWIYSHTGIRNRHIAEDNEAASDLGYGAAIAAIEATTKDGGVPVRVEDLDLILCATATPDYPGFPATACVIQDKLGAKKAGAMDLVAACTGFIYGIETARNFIAAGAARHVLVIGTEVFSKIMNWNDRGTCVLFGDGAGAAIVSRDDDPKNKIGKSILRSDGSGAEHLLRPAGGSRTPFVPGVTPPEEQFIKMNGRQVYVFAVQAIIDTVHELLEVNGLVFDDIDLVVPHQANRRILEAACKREGWPEERFYMNMEEYANTSAASIPLAMDELLREGTLKRGMKILTIGFGGGLTYGGNIFEF